MPYYEFIEEFYTAPFIRILLPLVAGVVGHTSVYAFPPYAIFFCAFGLCLMLLAYKKVKSYTGSWIFGLFVNVYFFCVGVALVQNLPETSSLPLAKEIKVVAIVTDEPSVSPTFAKLNLQVLAYEDSTTWKSVREKVLLYLRLDTTELPQMGDKLVLAALFSPIPKPQNLYEFDYAQYQQQHSVFASAFANSETYRVIAKNTLEWYKVLPKKLRKNALAFFEKQGLSGEHLSVLQALTLGDKSRLDTDLRKAYASAGAMHILAVSGLHVGIISMMLGFLLRPLEKRKRGKVLRGIIILLCMWSYALLAGLSASVLRATIMFTVLTIGTMLNRSSNTYNTLAFSAFLIALFDPLCFYDTGFQLSYSAVLSILFFQPRIYNLFYVKTRVGDAVWALIAVSVAANIGTLPITLLMFHQIPVYFILTNILVTIPTIFVMGGFLTSLTFAWLPAISWLFIWVTKYSIIVLNTAIRFVESLPYSLLEGVWITPLQTILLLLSVLFFALFWWIKRSFFLFVVLLSLIGFFSLRLYHTTTVYRQKILIVHAVKNTSLISIINGKEGFSICDSTHLHNNFDFNLKNLFVSLGFSKLSDLPKFTLQETTEIESVEYGLHKNFIYFSGKTLKILADEILKNPPTPLPIDYLILTSKCRLKPKEIMTIYQPKQIIIDASVSYSVAKRYLYAFKQHNIVLHNVRDQGAFVHKF
ncbi:MAG: ComEC/Rec2 family competence protein [Bacteroidales bacterium]